MCASRSQRTQAQNKFNYAVGNGLFALGTEYLYNEWVNRLKQQFKGFTNCRALPMDKLLANAAKANGLGVTTGNSKYAEAAGLGEVRYFKFYKEEA